jgi:hypothetical protein
MEKIKSDITIYYDGKVININAKSITPIGNIYHFKSEKDGIGETVALIPIDRVAVIFNHSNNR